MIVAHIGLDGSGKSYGMAQDAYRVALREAKRRNGKEIWSIRPMEGAGRITHPHQILYLTNSIIFLDELQRYYPADNRIVDEITQHIVSTHRHDKNTIHWASQAWEYVNAYWRRETAYAWQYRALWRDPMSGESKIHLHERTMITGIDKELGRRRPEIIKKQRFWITKKGIARYNSYEKIDVVMKDIDPDYIATIVDPHSTTDPLVNPYGYMEPEHYNLERDQELNSINESIEREEQAYQPGPVLEQIEPVEDIGGKRAGLGKYGRDKCNQSPYYQKKR